ncbi:MAG TPA: DsbA family protein [Caulobacteraceae bacterium]|nr:DsbA family protein [Caulobacteraceae bacterium]
MPTVSVNIDYKSPYAFIAKDLIYEMAKATGATLDWLPYTLDIPSYRGAAEVDDAGKVIWENRTPHQWRQVRYAYMDCRREANKRGLVLRGTQKIWDSSIAAIGLLWAKRQGDAVLRGYTDRTFERFWRRELNIEDPAVVQGCWRKRARTWRASPLSSSAPAAPNTTPSEQRPRISASSACPASSSMASSSGARSTCPPSARGSCRQAARTGERERRPRQAPRRSMEKVPARKWWWWCWSAFDERRARRTGNFSIERARY